MSSSLDDIPVVVRSVSSEMPPRGESKATVCITKKNTINPRIDSKSFVAGIIKGSAVAAAAAKAKEGKSSNNNIKNNLSYSVVNCETRRGCEAEWFPSLG